MHGVVEQADIAEGFLEVEVEWFPALRCFLEVPAGNQDGRQERVQSLQVGHQLITRHTRHTEIDDGHIVSAFIDTLKGDASVVDPFSLVVF